MQYKCLFMGYYSFKGRTGERISIGFSQKTAIMIYIVRMRTGEVLNTAKNGEATINTYHGAGNKLRGIA